MKGGFQPIAGTQVDEIGPTLPAFQEIPERLVWMRHFGRLADRNGSSGASQPAPTPTVKIERQQWSET